MVDTQPDVASSSDELEDITVWTGDPAIEEAFRGRWLVEPDENASRSRLDGVDAGAYFGVARTKLGRIAVYTAHCNEKWPGRLEDFDDLDHAEAKGVPADILRVAARELGDDRPLRRDI